MNGMNKSLCKARVGEPGRSMRTHQCQRKAQQDGWCWQHHPDAIAERDHQSKERWQREIDSRSAPHRKLEQAQAEIVRLTEQRDALLKACEDARSRLRLLVAEGILAYVNTEVLDAAIAHAQAEAVQPVLL